MENLIELNKNELQEINGGHWYCELAARVEKFFDGLADGFERGWNAARASNPFT